MKVEINGQAALITRAAGGIRRALAVALASRGMQVTVLDLKTEMGEETVALVEEQHAKISFKRTSPSAIFIHCDVTKPVFGRLDICTNNGGIGGEEPFYEGVDWRRVIDVNLVAVIEGTSKAIQAMKGPRRPDTECRFGIRHRPHTMYSASKAGAAMFTRSIDQIGKGIWVNAICAEYVETPLHDVPADLMDILHENLGFVKMERVLAGEPVAFFISAI